MNPKPPFDLELEAVGKGCLTSCLVKIVSTILLVIILLLTAGEITTSVVMNAAPGLRPVTFLIDIAGGILIGYITATAVPSKGGPHSKLIHAGIVAGLIALLSLPNLMRAGNFRDAVSEFNWRVVTWFFTIGAIMFGAWIVAQREK
jgi:hypothetical protein